MPAFAGPQHRFGLLDLPLLHRWARWEHQFGIVSTVPVVATTFDTRFAPH